MIERPKEEMIKEKKKEKREEIIKEKKKKKFLQLKINVFCISENFELSTKSKKKSLAISEELSPSSIIPYLFLHIHTPLFFFFFSLNLQHQVYIGLFAPYDLFKSCKLLFSYSLNK